MHLCDLAPVGGPARGDGAVSGNSIWSQRALSKFGAPEPDENGGGRKRMVALAIRTQLRGHSQSQYGKFDQKLAPAKRGKGKEKARAARKTATYFGGGRPLHSYGMARASFFKGGGKR